MSGSHSLSGHDSNFHLVIKPPFAAAFLSCFSDTPLQNSPSSGYAVLLAAAGLEVLVTVELWQ
jgi:hypothetical protein